MSQTQKKLIYNEVKEVSFFDELIEWSKDKSLYYWIIVICSWLSIGLAFYHLFVAVYGTPEGRSFRSVHLSAMMVLAVCFKLALDLLIEPSELYSLGAAGGH